jgi:hypothetical protein
MSEDARADVALEAGLAALRAELRELRAPDAESALLAAYRARLAASARELAVSSSRAAAPRTRFSRRPFALAAAVLLTAVTALVASRVERAERDTPPTASAVAVVPEAPEPAGAFRPLAFARGVSAAESYSVVRVRIQLATFAPGAGAPSDAAIEADLLVGEDGLARAIRFDKADTVFVSGVAKESGERR